MHQWTNGTNGQDIGDTTNPRPPINTKFGSLRHKGSSFRTLAKFSRVLLGAMRGTGQCTTLNRRRQDLKRVDSKWRISSLRGRSEMYDRCSANLGKDAVIRIANIGKAAVEAWKGTHYA